MRQWLKNGGCIPEHLPGRADRNSVDDLTAKTAGFAEKVKGRSDAIQLERKKDVRKRLGYSPDFADALACTFALPMAPLPAGVDRNRPAVLADYDPLSPPAPSTAVEFDVTAMRLGAIRINVEVD
jgi:hypothetical protein